MKPADFKRLIERFYSGETSETEEFQLRQYFEQKDLPTSHLGYKAHFLALQEMQQEALGDDFNQSLMDQLKDEPATNKFRIWLYRISSVAAIILLFIVVWFGTDLLKPKEVYGTITDPVLAFAETQKVLDEVSKKMNKGLTPAKKTVDKVEKSVQKTGELKKLDKALNKAKKINKLEEASELLKSFNKVVVTYGNS